MPINGHERGGIGKLECLESSWYRGRFLRVRGDHVRVPGDDLHGIALRGGNRVRIYVSDSGDYKLLFV